MRKIFLTTKFQLVALLLFAGATFAGAADYYVKTDGTATSAANATSWITAHSNLQTVLTAATADADRVFVAAGTYTGSFTIKGNILLRGGFAGNETLSEIETILAAAPDTTVNKTILKSSSATSRAISTGSKTGAISCFYITESTGGASITYGSTLSYCVVYGNGTGSSGGAGINISNTGGIIQNCIIRDNTSSGAGGGIYTGNCADTKILNCIIKNNTAGSNSGGVYLYGGVVDGCTISGNTSTSSGGGVYMLGATAALRNSIVSDNKASGTGADIRGGGVYTATGASGKIISNCTVRDNILETSSENPTNVYGGGIFLFTVDTVWNCIVTGNETRVTGSNVKNAHGGGIYAGQGSVLANCLVAGNKAASNGGGVNIGLNAKATNMTIAGNTAATGGGIYLSNQVLTVSNSIIWGNAATTGSDVQKVGSNATLTYSIYSEATGENIAANMNVNPLFKNVSEGDYRLTSSSPAVDAGASDALIPNFDLNGNPRINGAAIDLGAYEYATYTVTLPLVTGATTNPAAETQTVVDAGDDFSFTIALEEGYNQSVPVVTTNREGETIALSGGSYTVSNVQSNIEISIQGIQENMPTENVDAVNGGIRIYSSEGKIIISSGRNAVPYAVYDIAGQKVASSAASRSIEEIVLSPGYYIVKAGSVSVKLVVK
jgi:hypothetical protein